MVSCRGSSHLIYTTTTRCVQFATVHTLSTLDLPMYMEAVSSCPSDISGARGSEKSVTTCRQSPTDSTDARRVLLAVEAATDGSDLPWRISLALSPDRHKRRRPLCRKGYQVPCHRCPYSHQDTPRLAVHHHCISMLLVVPITRMSHCRRSRL